MRRKPAIEEHWPSSPTSQRRSRAWAPYCTASSNLRPQRSAIAEPLHCVPISRLHTWVGPTCRLLTGDFENGLQEYEWRWKTGQLWRRDYAEPEWKGEPLEGRTLLIHAEQGLGDTIQFIRYAELVKASGGRVLVECHPALRELLKSYECADGLIATGDELPHFDVQLPLLSVPRMLKTSSSRIPCRVPYLAVNPRLVAAWREKLASRDAFRIAINWHGRAGQEMFRLRNVPLHHFAALGKLPGVQLISIQKGEGRRELSEASNREALWDFHEEIDTEYGPFMDTAAIMMNVDLVITSDTAVPHLAGALGVPVWVALPYVPDWRGYLAALIVLGTRQ